MANEVAKISLIKGDGIGVDVTDAAMAVVDAALARTGGRLERKTIQAGAGYFAETGADIEPGGEQAAGQADAIFLGAIGLPAVRHADGTEISPHLRLRDVYELYA
ncbi:MAG: isocitrate/isopropylmalate family dehydrogenase, partial [Pikeienuella sp.]